MSPTYVENPKVQYRVAEGWVNGLTGEITPLLGFPTETTVGIAAIPGWTSESEVTSDEGFVTLVEEGAVYEDMTFTDVAVVVRKPHVTFRRCLFDGSFIQNFNGPEIANGLLVEDCTFRLVPPGVWPADVIGFVGISVCGFTLRRCAMLDVHEAVHTGFSLDSGGELLDPDDPLGYTVRIYDCYLRIAGPYDNCFDDLVDYHGDVIQCADTGLPGGGVPLRIRNTTLWSIDREGCEGNSCFTTDHGHSLPPDADGMILYGGALGMYLRSGGDWRNIYFVEDTNTFGPTGATEEEWAEVTTWEAYTCTLDDDGQVDELTATIPHGWPGFGPLDPPP